MPVFLDFEASSLGERSYPIEVGWVFADGAGEAHLIRPAPEWTDWDPAAERIHGIGRGQLMATGTPYGEVARRMVEALTGHDLCASAPSWDGKWLSALLRAAGFPRGTLRLRDSDAVFAEAARAILAPAIRPERLEAAVADTVALSELREKSGPPAHRALADAEAERQQWLRVCRAAQAAAARLEAQREP